MRSKVELATEHNVDLSKGIFKESQREMSLAQRD